MWYFALTIFTLFFVSGCAAEKMSSPQSRPAATIPEATVRLQIHVKSIPPICVGDRVDLWVQATNDSSTQFMAYEDRYKILKCQISVERKVAPLVGAAFEECPLSDLGKREYARIVGSIISHPLGPQQSEVYVVPLSALYDLSTPGEYRIVARRTWVNTVEGITVVSEPVQFRVWPPSNEFWGTCPVVGGQIEFNRYQGPNELVPLNR